MSITRRLFAALMIAAATATAVTAVTVPANATAAGEVCTNNVDTRSKDNWTSVESSICINNGDWTHGYFKGQCWKGDSIGWNKGECEVHGNFEIRKGAKIIKSDGFWQHTGLDGKIGISQVFTFSCEGSDTYTFKISGAHGRLVRAPNFQHVDIRDVQVSIAAC